MNGIDEGTRESVGVLLCLEGQHAAVHERYAEAGDLWLVCLECGALTLDGPDPEADPGYGVDLTDDVGTEHHVEPPC